MSKPKDIKLDQSLRLSAESQSAESPPAMPDAVDLVPPGQQDMAPTQTPVMGEPVHPSWEFSLFSSPVDKSYVASPTPIKSIHGGAGILVRNVDGNVNIAVDDGVLNGLYPSMVENNQFLITEIIQKNINQIINIIQGGGGLDYTADEEWININAGTRVVSHIGPSTTQYTYTIVTAFEVSGSNLALTQKPVNVDAKGHVVGLGDAATTNVALTEVTDVTAVRWDTSTGKLQYKSRTIKVVEAGAESGWTDFETAVECP